MNTFQQEVHRVADAFARLRYLKLIRGYDESPSNIKPFDPSVEDLKNVDTKSKEFKSIFREIKKSIIDYNTPAKYISLKELKELERQDKFTEQIMFGECLKVSSKGETRHG